MRAKDYLMRITLLDEILKNKREEIATLRESALGFGFASNSEKVQTSPTPDRLENSVIRFLEMEKRLIDEILEIEIERMRIISTIEQLPPAEYAVIYSVDVKGKTFNAVADALDKSYSYVSKKHSRGLKLLQEILNERDERTKG